MSNFKMSICETDKRQNGDKKWYPCHNADRNGDIIFKENYQLTCLNKVHSKLKYVSQK